MNDSKPSIPKPVVIPTKKVLAGFAAENKPRGATMGRVEIWGYHTFDEGLTFYTMLEAFDQYVEQAGLRPGCVEAMLVCISRRETHIYANEQLPIIVQIRPKRDIIAGERVYRDDIAGVKMLEFPNVVPPPESGFLLLLSVGWRRGLCFDLRPVVPPHPLATSEQAFDGVKKLGGLVYAHLQFLDRFLLTDEDWNKVFAAGWFPFIFLPDKAWQRLLLAIRREADLQQDEEQIHTRWLSECDRRLAAWKKNRYFTEQIPFLQSAVDAYKREEWMTVVSVAVPRVEGLLRMAFGPEGKQMELVDRLAQAAEQQEHVKSIMFPRRLAQFFRRVFLRGTPFSKAEPLVSRHTVTHGVVRAENLTRKEALTVLLLIDHILYCMPMDEAAATS